MLNSRMWKAINVTALRNSWFLFSVAYYPHNYWQPWLKNYNGEQGFSFNFWYANKFLWVDFALKKEKVAVSVMTDIPTPPFFSNGE